MRQDFVKSTGVSMWHMSGTVKMGKPDDVNACVDVDCRVKGVQGLRVVDMSVVPFVPKSVLPRLLVALENVLTSFVAHIRKLWRM